MADKWDQYIVPEADEWERYAVMKEPASEKPDLLSRIGTDIGKAYTELTTPVEAEGGMTDTTVRMAEKGLYAAGHLGTAALDAMTTAIGGIYNLTTTEKTRQRQRETVSDLGESIGETDFGKRQVATLRDIKRALEGVETVAPRFTKAAEAGANAFNLIPAYQAAKMTLPVAKAAAKVAVKVPQAIIGEMIPESWPQKLIASGAKWSTTLPPETRAGLTDTMIKEKILLNPKGYSKLESTVDGLNEEIKTALKPIVDQPLDARKVVSRVSEAREKAMGTYDPELNLAKISAEEEKFLGNWDGKLTVGDAQSVKQDIYKQLKKHYESVSKTGTAIYADGEIAAMKNIARGLKEEIEIAAKDVPIKALNARESELLTLEPHLRRAVGRIENHNILSLDDVLAAGVGVALGGPLGVGFGVAKKALGSPSVKSRIAMGLENMRNKPPVIPEAIPPSPEYATRGFRGNERLGQPDNMPPIPPEEVYAGNPPPRPYAESPLPSGTERVRLEEIARKKAGIDQTVSGLSEAEGSFPPVRDYTALDAIDKMREVPKTKLPEKPTLISGPPEDMTIRAAIEADAAILPSIMNQLKGKLPTWVEDRLMYLRSVSRASWTADDWMMIRKLSDQIKGEPAPKTGIIFREAHNKR
jgi:hypothetical protein